MPQHQSKYRKYPNMALNIIDSLVEIVTYFSVLLVPDYSRRKYQWIPITLPF